MRPRREYAIAAVVAFVFGAVVTARSSDLYFRSDVGVLGWAFTLTGGLTMLSIGAVAGISALSWPSVPPLVRRLAPGYPSNPRSMWNVLSRGARIAIAIMASLVAIGAVAVVVALSWVMEIDRPIYFDWLEAGSDKDRWGPDWFNRFGQPIPMVFIAVAVFLITFLRCRVVAIAYPLAIAAGGAIYLTINWTVYRLRPPFSAHAGEHNSYPGGHSTELALVLLALPLVVRVLTSNRFVRVIGTIVPIGVWATTEIDTIRSGGHWPIDQVAGLLIAACLLTIVYSVGFDAIRHESCHGAGLRGNDHLAADHFDPVTRPHPYK